MPGRLSPRHVMSGLGQMQPGQPLLGKRVAGRGKVLRPVERADQHVDLPGPARALVGQRRAALSAEAPEHARGRGEAGRHPGDIGKTPGLEAREGRHRRAGRPPAARAMAVGDPLRRPDRAVAHRPAEASPGMLGFGHDAGSPRCLKAIAADRVERDQEAPLRPQHEPERQARADHQQRQPADQARPAAVRVHRLAKLAPGAAL